MNVPELKELKYKDVFKYIKNNYLEFFEFLNKNYPSNISFQEKIYWYYNGINTYPLCPVCKTNHLKFKTLFSGYQNTCSIKCKNLSPDIKAKTKSTMIDRYGVENAFQSDEIKNRIKQTNLEKYGYEVPSKSDEIKSKARLKIKANFLNKHPDILDVQYGSGQIATIYKCKCFNENCNKCAEKTFEIDSLHYWVRKNNNILLCPKLLPIQPYHSEGTSLELFVRNILDKHNIDYIKNDKKILDGSELDIYIPDKKLAIECNGIRWHSDLYKDNLYHYKKYTDCANHNIKLITIWEDQVILKPNIIESIILSKLGIYKVRIGARACQIKEVSKKIAEKFASDNHIQGYINSSVRLGLYYQDELVSIMLFSKRKSGMGKYNNDTNSWELTRFCNKLHTQVIGGASKLFTFFIKKYKYSEIISYASHDISNGDIYNNLNFRLNNITKTSYWYIDKNTMTRYHRLNFSKKQLVKRGYDENKTEFQIMNSLNYYRIYDTGQSKYIFV